jgi:hypothetical protein
VPTLGQVAGQARFERLQGLLDSVKDTLLNELGMYAAQGGRGKIGQLPLALAFFGACDARAEEAARKRVHVSSEKHSPSK